MKMESQGSGEYFGVTIDGDKRFLLADYIVTHNTLKQGAANHILMFDRKDNATIVDMTSTKNKYGTGGTGWKTPLLITDDTAQIKQTGY
jgi:hypothetical protein